jgi:prepilin-type N-terminal cleavage/methylation domain-containing protein
MKFLSNLKLNNTRQKGFTIIELLVVIFIVGVISGLVMFNYKSFRSDVSVENLAQDIGLAIRRAQVYAVSTKGADNTTFPSYGVHFNIPGSNPILGTEKAFVLFADLPDYPTIGQYDQNSGACGIVNPSPIAQDECMEIINITTQDKITALCDDKVCYDSTNDPSVDIVFTRPNTEAEFCFKVGSTTCANPSNIRIKVESVGKTERYINVWNTGLISVK